MHWPHALWKNLTTRRIAFIMLIIQTAYPVQCRSAGISVKDNLSIVNEFPTGKNPTMKNILLVESFINISAPWVLQVPELAVCKLPSRNRSIIITIIKYSIDMLSNICINVQHISWIVNSSLNSQKILERILYCFNILWFCLQFNLFQQNLHGVAPVML